MKPMTDQELFQQLDATVNEKRLYLNPKISRSDLRRIIKVDKNRFAYIIRTQSGATNSTNYINLKRMAYAAELLRKHPNMAIKVVAYESGMNHVVTFHRVFRNIFGMTPSKYREQNQETS